MNVAFKKTMNLTQAKTLIKAVKNSGGKIKRYGSANSASLQDHRGLTTTLIFKSNLELRNLI